MEKISSDLHFHTTDSDGIATNQERIKQILRLDKAKQWIWAATNHDRFSPWFVEWARAEWIQAIWATEISAHSDALNLSLHVTCYTPILSEQIRSIVSDIILRRQDKIRGQIEKLQVWRFPINETEFFAWIEASRMSPESATNWHIAQYLWKKKSARELASDLTNGNVASELDFMRECLREHGDYADIWYHRIPRYEPELDTIAAIAKKEGAILSIAHPNFSFTRKLKTDYGARSSSDRIQAFRERIIPIISDAGIYNYEVNAMANPAWKEGIIAAVQRTWGMITFWSDNHGISQSGKKHGIFGQINKHLDTETITPIISQLRSFVP